MVDELKEQIDTSVANIPTFLDVVRTPIAGDARLDRGRML